MSGPSAQSPVASSSSSTLDAPDTDTRPARPASAQRKETQKPSGKGKKPLEGGADLEPESDSDSSSEDEDDEEEEDEEDDSKQGTLRVKAGIHSPANDSEAEEDVDETGRPPDPPPHGASNAEENGKKEEEEEEEDDGEEEEPALKYSRLKGRIPEILAKDSASAIAVSQHFLALGTQNGLVHVLSYEGAKVKSFRPHDATVMCIRMDEEDEFVATASMDGRIAIHSLTSSESHSFDYKRQMRAIALEPGFSKKSTRAFVCGGMAGNLILQEKGWLGYKERILHSGEGPIWAIEWRGNYIAWANDLGVKIYDTTTDTRIGFVDRGANAPRAELFKCNLLWKDNSTLIIAWADYIKVVRVRHRKSGGNFALSVEMNSIFQVDCMISGISPFSATSYLILAYIPPDTFDNEATTDRAEQRRKAANPPELRIIDGGEEVSADALSLANYHMYGCNDYSLIQTRTGEEKSWLVVSLADLVMVRPRDEKDHVEWLVEKERFEEALEQAEALQDRHGVHAYDAKAIGIRYMEHLVSQEDFARAAGLAPKVLKGDAEGWEKWIREFGKLDHLPTIIPVVPVKEPRLSRAIYETILNHLLIHDKPALLSTIKSWPADIYDIPNMIITVQDELGATKDDPILLECLGELYLTNRQPAKALPYFLRLRKPHVFDLIREFNLFTAVQDQALLLVEFDQERIASAQANKPTGPSAEGETEGNHGAAIKLLVDHTHSIPVPRVISQLEPKPKYLYMYLDALFAKDPALVLGYSDRMVELYAAYDLPRLMPFLRASNFYDLEKAYRICKDRDYVPEMVFLLGRMGNNKQALMLIIERLGDVQRAIDFAKEQADEDLWEDLLTYSETRPNFIRALLEHVGAEINPIRLIRRIRDGLEIPGLKPAVVKILQSLNLQVSLLQGCQAILNGDCAILAGELHEGQTAGSKASIASLCEICKLPALLPAPAAPNDPPLTLIYFCRHIVHAHCALPNPDIELPERPDSGNVVSGLLHAEGKRSAATRERELGAKLSYEAAVRVRVGGCPVCAHRGGADGIAEPGQAEIASGGRMGVSLLRGSTEIRVGA